MFKFGKRKFDAKLFRPTGGMISGMFFSNPHLGIETSLFFAIKIELASFKYDKEIQETSIMLDFVTLPVTSYVELANQEFNFPTNPTEGYIDGSVYISHMHNPFDVTKIKFGSIENNTIEADFFAQLLFEDDSVKPTDVNISANLQFGDVTTQCDKLLSMSSGNMQACIKDQLDLKFFLYNEQDKVFKYNTNC